MGKRYFWLKLKDDFFTSKRIKKLRKLAGGDTFTIIYLKLQLKAMKSEGILTWTGLEDDIASELALDLDEEPDNVAVTLQYLLSCGLAETDDNVAYFFPYAVENVGSETASAQRVRDFRSRAALQCNAQALQSNTDVTQVKRKRNVEKEIEKEKEPEIDTDGASEDDDDGFDEFWKAYPRKSGDIREAYMAYIGALQKGATLAEMLEALEWQTVVWAADDPSGRYIPSPRKWLENQQWTEKRREPKKKTTMTAAEYAAAGPGKVDMDALQALAKRVGAID